MTQRLKMVAADILLEVPKEPAKWIVHQQAEDQPWSWSLHVDFLYFCELLHPVPLFLFLFCLSQPKLVLLAGKERQHLW